VSTPAERKTFGQGEKIPYAVAQRLEKESESREDALLRTERLTQKVITLMKKNEAHLPEKGRLAQNVLTPQTAPTLHKVVPLKERSLLAGKAS